MFTSRSGILAEAINTMYQTSIGQENGEGNALRIDPSNNLGNFNRYFKSSFNFTLLTLL